MKPPNDQIALDVADASGVGEVRRLAVSLAAWTGFDETARGQLAIVVTELASNLVKHARSGEMLLRLLRSERGGGIEVISLDNGPGIDDVERAMRDGYSTATSPGTGLGAVRRLSDEMDVYSVPSTVTAVLARIWPKNVGPRPTFPAGVVQLPASGESVCGDAWAVDRRDGRTRAMVVDGLGHGPLAAVAAREAVRVFRDDPADSPEGILRSAHQALRPTRGAAAAIAEIDPAAQLVRFAGTGNVAGTVVTSGSSRSMASMNGTLGLDVHRFRTFAYPWGARALLVMHSDGLSTHWSFDRYPGLAARDPALVAGVLYRDHSRRRDDVTVLVIRETNAGGAP